MTPRLLHATAGAAALEFALVAPMFILIVVLLLQGAVAFQQWNAMTSVAGTVARCIAIGSPRCTTASGSSSVDPATAYAIQVAAAHAAGVLTADRVAIDTVTSADGITYRRVTITVPVDMLGASFTLSAVSRFPQT